MLLNEIIKSEPQFLVVYYFRGDAYERLGKHEESLLDIDHCLALLKSANIPDYDDYYPCCYRARAQVLCELSRRKEALAAINLALALTPDDPATIKARRQIVNGLAPFPHNKREADSKPSKQKKK